jgi:hypothetical protein
MTQEAGVVRRKSKLPSEAQKAANRASGAKRALTPSKKKPAKAAPRPLTADELANLKPHPIADCLPMPDDETCLEIGKDILANGLREPIDILDGLILDGRVRHRAMGFMGMKVTTLHVSMYQGSAVEAALYVISKNIHRRHLTTAQRAAAALKLANLGEGRPRKTPQNCGVSQRQAAKAAGVSERSMQHVSMVQKQGGTAVQEALDKGEIKPHTAATIAKMPIEKQDAAVLAAITLERQKKKPKVKKPKAKKGPPPTLAISYRPLADINITPEELEASGREMERIAADAAAQIMAPLKAMLEPEAPVVEPPDPPDYVSSTGSGARISAAYRQACHEQAKGPGEPTPEQKDRAQREEYHQACIQMQQHLWQFIDRFKEYPCCAGFDDVREDLLRMLGEMLEDGPEESFEEDLNDDRLLVFCGETIWPRKAPDGVMYGDAEAAWWFCKNHIIYMERSSLAEPPQIVTQLRHWNNDLKTAGTLQGFIKVVDACLAAYAVNPDKFWSVEPTDMRAPPDGAFK